MNKEQILRTALQEWTSGLSPVQARVKVFERVREMGYVYPSSKDPLVVLQEGRGSGAGKHYLLGELFRLLGLSVRNMLCVHRFNESPIGFPDHLQLMLEKNEIMDLHDYVQIAVDGKWIDIDATWPTVLREFGFPVNDEWDGTSSMLLSVSPEEVIVVRGDPEKAKDELLSKWTPRQRQLRKQFLEGLSAWVAELVAEGQR